MKSNVSYETFDCIIEVEMFDFWTFMLTKLKYAVLYPTPWFQLSS